MTPNILGLGETLTQTSKFYYERGYAVAEWSKALLVSEKIKQNQKKTGSPTGLTDIQ